MYNFTNPCPWNPCPQKTTIEFGVEGLRYSTLSQPKKLFSFHKKPFY